MKKNKTLVALLTNVALAVIVFMVLTRWQERDMLESNTPAPRLTAYSLDGEEFQFPLVSKKAKHTLVYFFAPWCKICHISIGNLNIIHNQFDGSELEIFIVALDWQSRTEIIDYMAEHELNFPVIMGDQQWQSRYKIQGFPTYYLLNSEGDIVARSMGYSSSIGMIGRILAN